MYLSEVVETKRSADGLIGIDKVVCAVDCGVPVNPDVIIAQMESASGLVMGPAISSFMRTDVIEVTGLTDGEVDQYNFPGSGNSK